MRKHSPSAPGALFFMQKYLLLLRLLPQTPQRTSYKMRVTRAVQTTQAFVSHLKSDKGLRVNSRQHH
jgi:hypothetical protein